MLEVPKVDVTMHVMEVRELRVQVVEFLVQICQEENLKHQEEKVEVVEVVGKEVEVMMVVEELEKVLEKMVEMVILGEHVIQLLVQEVKEAVQMVVRGDYYL